MVKAKNKEKRELTFEDKFFIFKFVFLIFAVVTLVSFFTVASIKLSDTVKFNNDLDGFPIASDLDKETYTPIVFMFIFAAIFIILFITLYFFYAEKILYYANLYQNDPA